MRQRIVHAFNDVAAAAQAIAGFEKSSGVRVHSRSLECHY